MRGVIFKHFSTVNQYTQDQKSSPHAILAIVTSDYALPLPQRQAVERRENHNRGQIHVYRVNILKNTLVL